MARTDALYAPLKKLNAISSIRKVMSYFFAKQGSINENSAILPKRQIQSHSRDTGQTSLSHPRQQVLSSQYRSYQNIRYWKLPLFSCAGFPIKHITAKQEEGCGGNHSSLFKRAALAGMCVYISCG